MNSQVENLKIPKHIAIIMDGNGRWAKTRSLPRTIGHAKGAMGVRELLKFCAHKGVKYLTLFAFSTENWGRPKEEVSHLMDLFLQYLENELKNLLQAGVRLQVIGNIAGFDQVLQDRISNAVKATEYNESIVLTVAANYGGKWDIIGAIQRWQKEYPNLTAGDITQEQLAMHLSTVNTPDPDLIIRTGGEHRVSNFLLWQMAYSEIYFTEVLWPDFDVSKMNLALDWYKARQRRFGRICKED